MGSLAWEGILVANGACAQKIGCTPFYVIPLIVAPPQVPAPNPSVLTRNCQRGGRKPQTEVQAERTTPRSRNVPLITWSKDPKYKLHGVLVHSRHSFALIKSDQDIQWLKFDDDWVTLVTDREVLEENYGGEPLNRAVPRHRVTRLRQ